MAATLGEWLAAAEYVARGGNEDILLCERGVRGLGNGEYDRNTLDLNVIPALLERTHLPVIADPSHGTGVATMVARASLAAVAFGAHGLILEALPAAAAFARREAEHAMEEVAAVADPPALTREERNEDPEGEGHRCSA
jgi:3-deoxy-7-phosphoheptulonate synthase